MRAADALDIPICRVLPPGRQFSPGRQQITISFELRLSN
jgi:hypothetical protein